VKSLHAFVSYTTREEEVRLVQPLVDGYCRDLWQWASSQGVEVFYDHFSLPKIAYSDEQLIAVLGEALARAQFFVGFISPCYVESRWCCFEWRFGPMRDMFARSLALPTQAINWKPDFQDAVPFDPGVPSDLQRRQHTDVRFIYRDPLRLREAASLSVADAQRILAPVLRSA
jgi:hypothetical protein